MKANLALLDLAQKHYRMSETVRFPALRARRTVPTSSISVRAFPHRTASRIERPGRTRVYKTETNDLFTIRASCSSPLGEFAECARPVQLPLAAVSVLCCIDNVETHQTAVE